MEKSLISIIIPVFNAEKYLEECLESIKEQTYTNYEVLMVDDGSTDKSSQICKKYNKINSKFKYFFQKNSGPSSARNLGIQQSNGKFIVFVDADDIIDSNYLEQHCTCIEEFHADLSISSYDRFYHDDMERKIHYQLSNFSYSVIDDQLELAKIYRRPSTNLFGISVWGKMYRKELIIKNDISFPEDIHYEEDCCFNIQYFKCIKRTVIIKEAVYHYRQIENSLSKDYKTNTVKDLVNGYNLRKEYVSQLGMPDNELENLETVFLMALINNYKKIAMSTLNSNEKKQAYTDMLSYAEVKTVFLQAKTPKTRLTRYLIKFSKKENISLIFLTLNLWIIKKNFISKLKGLD